MPEQEATTGSLFAALLVKCFRLQRHTAFADTAADQLELRRQKTGEDVWHKDVGGFGGFSMAGNEAGNRFPANRCPC
ncbi:hypothetical protein B5P46_15150 [Rhizobium leguminosarum]|uniref:Uncharacterized protein n=1 Tax=Rhizobium leguminosarum TaxID=384 RepID=A0A4V1P1W3_RHILE|nr:hypothetical protein B5P46_15150 [Rhizobium leguminosarum]